MKDSLPVMLFATAGEWQNWLEEGHANDGIWIRIAKKGSGISSVSYDQALEVALCYGWIDGLKRRFDDSTWIQKFTPRRKYSNWSRINREKAERLINEGKMKPTGLEAIEAARKNGRWERAYEELIEGEISDDLK